MIRHEKFLGALLALSALSLPLAAQSGNSGGQTGKPAPAGNPPGQTGGTTGTAGQMPNAAGTVGNVNQGLALQRGDKLIGMEVQDATGARIGRIEDLVLNANGTIAYAVISGPDGQTSVHPVPWRSLRFPPASDLSGKPDPMGKDKDAGGKDHAGKGDASGKHHATLVGVDAARWKSAPKFDRGSWPKDEDRTVFRESDTFFGASSGSGTGGDLSGKPTDPTLPQGTSTSYWRASKLQNQVVTDSSGQPVGRIGTLVFDPVAGRVNYSAISLEGSGTAAGRTIAMPWETLRVSRQDQKDRFLLSTSSDRLREAPQFQSGDDAWRQMSDPRWVGELYEFYSVRPYWNASAGANPSTNSGTPAKPNPKPDGPAGPSAKPVDGQ